MKTSDLAFSSFILHPSSFPTLEPSEIADRLQRLIRRLDALAVQLERALRFDERDQLLHRIDVAAFEIALENLPRSVFARPTVNGLAGRFGFLIQAAAQKRQTLRVDEIKELD